jgi:hypothetical protein
MKLRFYVCPLGPWGALLLGLVAFGLIGFGLIWIGWFWADLNWLVLGLYSAQLFVTTLLHASLRSTKVVLLIVTIILLIASLIQYDCSYSVLKHCASYRYAHSLLVRYRSLFGCPHYLYCIVHALYIRCTHIIVLCTRLCSLYRSHSRVYSLHSLDTQVFAPCLVTIRYTHVSSTDETCVDLKVLNVSMCGT